MSGSTPVVWQSALHEQRAEVRVSESELPVRPGVLSDPRGRVVRVADEDLLRGEDELDRTAEALDIELTVAVEESHEVHRREVAGRVVDAHVLRTGVRSVDPTGNR